MLALGAIGGTYIAQRNEVQGFLIRWQTANYDPTSRPEFKDQFLTTITDTVSALQGTARDTTSVFEVRAYMTAYIFANDTTSTDSVDITYFFYMAPKNQFRRLPPSWVEWVLVDSTNVTSDSTTTAWNITASAIPVGNWGMFISRGNTANKDTSAVVNKITMAIQDNP